MGLNKIIKVRAINNTDKLSNCEIAYDVDTKNIVFSSENNHGIPEKRILSSIDSTTLKATDIGKSIQAYDADTTKNDVNNTFTITQQATITIDDDGSFDMAVTNNFKCTTGDDLTLDFTNLDSGRGGVILFDNSDAHTISKDDKVLVDSDCLSTLSDGGNFLLSYITDGTDVYMTYSKALS